MTTASLITALEAQLTTVQTEIAASYGPNYSLSGRAGSEGMSLADYRKGLFDQQTELIRQLVELQPFQLVERKTVGSEMVNSAYRNW